MRNHLIALLALLMLASCTKPGQPAPPQPTTQLVLRQDWQRLYDSLQLEGAFVLHEIGSAQYQVCGEQHLHEGHLPASTFKIMNALVALEEGIVEGPNDTLRWDGKPRRIDLWNQDHTLASAMKCSAVWYYQSLARDIGRERMERWMREAQYGNGKTGSTVDSFWLRGDLRITPMEQVHFLERLAQDSLPFSAKTHQTVKDMILQDTTGGVKWMGKTGWADMPGDDTGWFVGIVETPQPSYAFANLLLMKKDEEAEYRRSLAQQILRQEGILR